MPGDDLLGRRKDVDSTCQMSRQSDLFPKMRKPPLANCLPSVKRLNIKQPALHGSSDQNFGYDRQTRTAPRIEAAAARQNCRAGIHFQGVKEMETEETLSKVWDQHVGAEFAAHSADQAVTTMTAEAYVNYVPLMIGAKGRNE